MDRHIHSIPHSPTQPVHLSRQKITLNQDELCFASETEPLHKPLLLKSTKHKINLPTKTTTVTLRTTSCLQCESRYPSLPKGSEHSPHSLLHAQLHID